MAYLRLLKAWVSCVLAIALGPRALAEEPGIYADLNTSVGTFTCQLEYVLAPKAVANFIGLASGQQAWIDAQNGRPHNTPYYDETLFHRVIAGFIIQGGSRNGLGTDGPGYAFPDEFHPSLRHSGAGILSSANSGTNSNGAQFFVTVAAAPWLDDVHTVFGHVVSGFEVVSTINQVATDANAKPLVPVQLTGIAIRRIGATAEAFDIHAQELPVVSAQPLGIESGVGEVSLKFTNSQYAAHRLVSSTDLEAWAWLNLGINLGPPEPGLVKVATSEPGRFFTLTQVQYPASTLAPADLRNRTLTLGFELGLTNTLTIQFDGQTGGTYTNPPQNPGAVLEYSWLQEAYRGAIQAIFFSDFFPLTLRLDFKDQTTGHFSGRAVPARPNLPFDVAGSFSLSSP